MYLRGLGFFYSRQWKAKCVQLLMSSDRDKSFCSHLFHGVIRSAQAKEHNIDKKLKAEAGGQLGQQAEQPANEAQIIQYHAQEWS